ncbi:hypothetical protein [Symbiopectobacterium purcellii]|uniref:hypothetical protein n=2 Tax=Symbiopectobacterium purcellii TaxID=2871826 RepID=UPI003F85819A
MSTSRLLIHENPLQVLPSLACTIGLNEAMVLQQIHYWLGNSRHVHNGRKWVYNSVAEWQTQFPFWSETTVKRALTSLEKQGLLLTANYNKDQRDRSKWYSINYDALKSLEVKNVDDASGQIDPNASGQIDQMQMVSLTQCIDKDTETTTEITTEIKNKTPLPLTDKKNKFDPLTEKPSNVSAEVWADWVEHRKEIRHPLTPTTCKRIRSMLENHVNPDAVIGLSIERGWQGLFPEKITEPANTTPAFDASRLTEEQRRELALYELLEGR